MDQNIVPADVMAEALRQAPDRALEALVLEGAEPATRIADDVMVVLAAGDHRLIPRATLPHLDPLDEADPVEQVERAVHARGSHTAAARPQAIRDLLCGEAAVLARELRHDSLASPAGALSRLTQRLLGELRPGVISTPSHSAENTSAVRMIIIPACVRMRMIFISVAALLLPVGLAACGSDDESGGGVDVVATTGIVADLVEGVGGADVDVTQIVPNGSSPHDFELSAQDRQSLEQADLVVASGADLEAKMPLDEVDAPQWALADHVPGLLPFEEAGARVPGASPDDSEEESFTHDPHVWMDPARVAAALPSLGDALAEADAAHADAYRRGADQYAKALLELDRQLTRELGSVPAADRQLVTSHDALGYFADHYDFEVVATAFPASGPEAEASAGRIDEVETAVRDADVPAVFAQEEDDPETLRLVAEETGVDIVDNLVIESPGNTGGYEPMLRRDADLISAALGGSTS
jgi:zinc/manganese transport system substrate-binding protein